MVGIKDYQTTMLGGIELYMFGPYQRKDAPLVFVLHYFTGRASYMFRYCRDLAREGIIAVTFDQRNHGRRLIDRKRNGRWKGCNDDQFFTQIVDMYSYLIGTALDISLLIDLMPARFGFTLPKVGVTGISLGGHATQMAMGFDSRITVGASMIGSGDLYTLLKVRWEKHGHNPADYEERYRTLLKPVMAKYDPIQNPQHFAGRPLLMLNGEADTLVPLVCNQNFYNSAIPYYTDKERLQHRIYPGVKHTVPSSMWDEARGWLVRWLIG